MAAMPALTPAQGRYLVEIRRNGERKYNGRARRPLEALRDAGLIEYDYTLVPVQNGRFTELFIARPVYTADPGFYVDAGQTDLVGPGPLTGPSTQE